MNLNLTTTLACLVFGSIGFVAFMYGKRQASFKPMMIGIALIAFPFFVSDPVLTIVIGSVLTAALFLFRG